MAKTVLIVEDEALVAMDLEAMLRQAGYQVLGPVGHESDALAILVNNECSMALLDAKLGSGGDIGQVAAVLKMRGVPFAFVSGYSQDALPAAFKDAHFLNKPFAPEQLIALLDRLQEG